MLMLLSRRKQGGWPWRLTLLVLLFPVSLVIAAEPKSLVKGAHVSTRWGQVAVFPADNPWNQPINDRPVDPKSSAYLESIGVDVPLHPDFGTEWNGAPNGIPWIAVGPDQPQVPVVFEYADESDPGPYPIPASAPIEGGPQSKGDRHVIVLDPHRKKLFELFSAYPQADGSWKAASGAVFDLSSNALRPAGWTSADAAGLPVFAGLVRHSEVVSDGEIRHALRFTVKRSQRAYAAPATHYASRLSDENLPPMGLRVRLKADVKVDQFPPSARVILQCLKTYGMFLADNGGDFYVSGEPHPEWKVDDLAKLKRIRVRDFECIETGPLVKGRPLKTTP